MARRRADEVRGGVEALEGFECKCVGVGCREIDADSSTHGRRVASAFKKCAFCDLNIKIFRHVTRASDHTRRLHTAAHFFCEFPVFSRFHYFLIFKRGLALGVPQLLAALRAAKIVDKLIHIELPPF